MLGVLNPPHTHVLSVGAFHSFLIPFTHFQHRTAREARYSIPLSCIPYRATLAFCQRTTPTQEKRCSFFGRQQSKSPSFFSPFFMRVYISNGKKKELQNPAGASLKLRSLSPSLRSSVSRHVSLFCLFCHLLLYARASFRQAAKNPSAAHNFARLRVAAGCGDFVYLPPLRSGY
jgi:hypothetical protein